MALFNGMRNRGEVVVGRTQELLYPLGKYRDAWNLQPWQLFLDSPLAIEATEIYLRHSHLFDDDALTLFNDSHYLPLLPNLRFSRSAEESMAINRVNSGAMIIAASGRCAGDRAPNGDAGAGAYCPPRRASAADGPGRSIGRGLSLSSRTMVKDR